jgi:hypothetical protein
MTEISPSVLGYIFEKYINQEEFRAYYTRPQDHLQVRRPSLLISQLIINTKINASRSGDLGRSEGSGCLHLDTDLYAAFRLLSRLSKSYSVKLWLGPGSSVSLKRR